MNNQTQEGSNKMQTNRTEYISERFTYDEKELLISYAKQYNLNLSEYIREVVLKQTPHMPRKQKKDIKALVILEDKINTALKKYGQYNPDLYHVLMDLAMEIEKLWES